MEIITDIARMQARSEGLRRQGQQIAFVPTMGYLHEGHLSLLQIADQQGDDIVLSIFVNPTQFGPSEDLDAYPRDPQRDLALAEKAGVDAVFMPQADDIYGNNFQTYISLTDLPAHLCGLSRPTHFRGVATVVTKLFHIVKPHLAVFGLKDYQQFAIIRQMVADLDFDIRIIGAPIVRESDGLAMSSRNKYLTSDQRPAALSLFQVLQAAREEVAKGQKEAAKIIATARAIIDAHENTKIDYINICDPHTLEDITTIDNQALMGLAVYVGKTRLIDNMLLDPRILP